MNSSQNAGLPGGWDGSHLKSMLRKLAEIVHPPPSGTFVFIDESEESIDDGLWNTPPFALAVPGVPVLRPGAHTKWDDLPTDRHNQGASIGFADGHVQHHKWLGPKRGWIGIRPTVNAADMRDLIWMLTLSPVEP